MNEKMIRGEAMQLSQPIGDSGWSRPVACRRVTHPTDDNLSFGSDEQSVYLSYVVRILIVCILIALTACGPINKIVGDSLSAGTPINTNDQDALTYQQLFKPSDILSCIA